MFCWPPGPTAWVSACMSMPIIVNCCWELWSDCLGHVELLQILKIANLKAFTHIYQALSQTGRGSDDAQPIQCVAILDCATENVLAVLPCQVNVKRNLTIFSSRCQLQSPHSPRRRIVTYAFQRLWVQKPTSNIHYKTSKTPTLATKSRFGLSDPLW